MDRRTKVAIERFMQLMERSPAQKYDACQLTTLEERNRAWEDKDRIFDTLTRVVRQAQEVLAEGNTAWELVAFLRDDDLHSILDPTMLDEEALREVEIYVREHF